MSRRSPTAAGYTGPRHTGRVRAAGCAGHAAHSEPIHTFMMKAHANHTLARYNGIPSDSLVDEHAEVLQRVNLKVCVGGGARQGGRAIKVDPK